MSKSGFAKNKYVPHWVNFGLFVVTLILNLNIAYSPDDWKDLTDSRDYLHQAKISLLDKEFYFPHTAKNFDPRPFTVPLFYKICRGNTDVIVQMQKFMLSLSAFLMVAVMIMFFEGSGAKYILMTGVYLLVSWWNVLGWSVLILSESLSTSLLFCWLASFLFLYKKGSWHRWWLHAVITLLFAFSRDSWPYVLLAFYAGICLLWLLLKQPGVKKYLALLAMCVIIFFTQQAGAKMGERSKLPVINSIVLRVLPDTAYTNWFVRNGMPDAERLKRNFGVLPAFNEDSAYQLWTLYNDTAYRSFTNWAAEKGQATYTRFLITHPRYVFLTDESPAQLSRIMSYNLFYIDEPRGYSVYVQSLFPLFNIRVVAVLCIVLMIIYIRRKTPILYAPVFLLLFTSLNALLCYNADALEVRRHLYLTTILLQLTGFWAVSLIWDSLEWRRSRGVILPSFGRYNSNDQNLVPPTT